MSVSRWVVLASLLIASVAWQTASGAPVFIPPGSTVWMKMQSHACSATSLDVADCAGSNQPGGAPPNGIPTTTFVDGLEFATGFAEILPNRVRIFTRSNVSAFMFASFQDTYTVGGTATGPFSITVDLHVTGAARSVPSGPPFQNILNAAFIEVEIGTFNPDPGDVAGGHPFIEQFRIEPFNFASNRNLQSIAGTSGPSPFSRPIDVATSYTRMVSVGDVFNIAYGVNATFAGRAEIDLLNTATISFDLPDGVFLTSALAQRLVPEPSGLALLALGLSLASIWPPRWRLLTIVWANQRGQD